MKLFGSTIVGVVLLGTQAFGGGCSDMAAFNTQINDFLQEESVAVSLKADVKKLATECELMHDKGMTVNTISACGDALKLTMVN